MKELTLDSPPEDKLDALKRVAEKLNSDLTHLICRDAAQKLLSVSVHATGEDAVALERWLKRRKRGAAATGA